MALENSGNFFSYIVATVILCRRMTHRLTSV